MWLPFLRAAKGHDAAAVLGDDVGEHVRCIGAVVAVLVERPALGERFLFLVVHLELAAGDDRRAGVEEEVVRVGRHRAGDGVAAEHRKTPIGRDHDRFGVCARKADQPLLAGHLGIIAGNTEMVGIPGTNDTHTAFLCLVDGKLHRFLTDKLPHPGIAFYHSTHGRFKNDLGSGVYIDHALLDPFVVADHALHAVAFDAVHIGHQEVLRDRLRLLRLKSEVHKSIHQKVMECIVGPFHITHRVSSRNHMRTCALCCI